MLKMQSFKRLLVWTLFLTLLLSIYLFRSSQPVKEAKLFLPELQGKVDHFDHIQIKMAETEWHIEKNNNRWVIKNKAGIEVNVAWLRELVQGLLTMKIVEPKTQNPNAFASIQVDLPNHAEAKGIQVEVFDKNNQALLNIVIGKRQARPTNPIDQLIFVRKVDESQSYLVESHLPEGFELNDVAKENLLAFQNEKIKRIKLHGPDEGFVLKRESEEESFKIITQNKENLKTSYIANDLVEELETFKLKDILPRESQNLDWEKAVKLSIKTFKGNQYTLSFLNQKDKIFISVPSYPDWLFVSDKGIYDKIGIKESDLLEALPLSIS
ncbi:MAG: DUF4340 domain-containing protein [Gammaproteobacteria bacterium]